MRVDLGSDVYDRGGDKVGTVDRIVVDPASRQVDKLVVRQGFLARHDILISIEDIGRLSDDGIYLDLTADELNRLPEFVEEQFTAIPEDDRSALPFLMPNAAGAGMYLWGASYAGRGFDERGSMFEPAAASAPIVENRSNIPEEDVVISEGTDVLGADGEKVGTVDEVVFDEHGRISGFIVRAGFIFTRDVRVPMDWVESAGDEHIRLHLDAANAEARSYDIEDSTL
ncbi:MAG TPA: PRC-barrel domain-containing protein [Thermomicrobiales bacterium]|nr:PRC-barrel domain-containing protein [Thermomicrobiales bacterium]